MNKTLSKIVGKARQFVARPERVFLLLAAVFGLFSAVLVPQLSANDENWHFARAYQISDGLVVCEDSRVSYPSAVNHKIYDAIDRKYSNNYADTADLSERQASECGAMKTYLPTMYIPQAIGVAIAKLTYPSPAFMVLMARLANLVLFVAVAFFLIRQLKVGKWVLVVIACMPQMIHLAASATTDAVNSLVILAIIVFMINLFCQKEKIGRRQVAWLLGLAVLAAATKQNNVILFLPLAFLPGRLFLPNRLKQIPFNLRKWGLNLAAGLSFSATFLIFSTFLSSSSVLPSISSDYVISSPLGFAKLVYNTYFTDYGDVVFLGVSNHFSSFGYHLPLIVTAVLIILFLFVLLTKSKADARDIKSFDLKNSLVFLLTLGLSIAAVTYIMYTAWSPIWTGGEAVWAEGVQGRYFSAMLLLLVPLGAYLSRYITLKFRSSNVLGWIVFATLLLILTYYTFLTYKYVNDGLLWAGGYLRL
jgi:uncharacterized membrane protein